MRVPVSWLREYVDVAESPVELADLLTAAGLEVTTVDFVGLEGAPLVWQRDKVLWAQVLKVERHPEADRLVLATVDYGAAEPKTVVTGAPNLFPFLDDDELPSKTLFSPLVLEGGVYLDPYKDGKQTKLKGKPLRGIYNDAMLCSSVELGLGEEHDGILLVDASEGGAIAGHVAGTPLQDVLGDAVLDIDIIPNIARCASIIGVAREVAALTGRELRLPSFEVEADGPPIAGRVEVHSDEPELNPRFVALLIEGVVQRPSPFWMQHRLSLAGQRPLHVVVDVSNYVMLELGQPNHTFDYDFLRQRADQYAPDGPIRIATRLAVAGEKLVTLDGVEHPLRGNNILVTDPAGNLSLGGIMGGRDSEIRDSTTNVLLEAAAWNFINIRRTSRQLGLHTEAGFRFSRGVHPSQALLGARRAAELLRLHASGTVAGGLIDHYPLPAEPVAVELDPAYVVRLSGLALSRSEIRQLLERLEFSVEEPAGETSLLVTAPDHRLDIEGPHDLVEEICRMYGYDRIPSSVLADVLPRQRGNPALELEDRIEDLLVEQGFRQVISYRLTTRESEARLGLDAADVLPYVELTNPSTRERAVLRHSVLSSLLEVAAANTRFADRLEMFELGRVFLPVEGEVLPAEPRRLALVSSGVRESAYWKSDEAEMLDFFDLKGAVEGLMSSLRLEVAYEAVEHPSFRPGRTALVSAPDGTALGLLGELHPLVVESYGFRVEKEQAVLAADFDLEALTRLVSMTVQVLEIPAYPAIREDLALVVDAGLPAERLRDAIAAAGKPLLTDVELFDVYEGDHMAPGEKSLAYHLTFQSASKTLKDKDAQKLRRKILAQVERSCGARLRE